jgi:tetratricopeptide (TPR) repeat protein
MRHRKNLYVLAAAVLLLTLTAGCTFVRKLKARDRLNKGVLAYQAKDYAAAEATFTEAIDLDPELLEAKLYLATTYRVQVMPVDTPEMRAMAEKAIQAFQRVLEQDKSNNNALASIAGLYSGPPLSDSEKAKEWHRTRLEARPDEPEPLYGIGTIDWELSYEKTGQTGENVENLTDEEKARVNALLDDGIDALQKALRIKPDYTDAMQYLNLIYREKAKLAKAAAAKPRLPKDEKARLEGEERRWLREADGLALKAIELKRQQEEQAEKDRRMLKTSGASK